MAGLTKPDKSGHKSRKKRLSPKTQKAIAAILSSPSRTAAAQSLGIGRSTLYEWIDHPGAKEALAARRQDQLDEIMELAHKAGVQMVATALKVMAQGDLKKSDPIAAARLIKDILFGRRESVQAKMETDAGEIIIKMDFGPGSTGDET